MPPPYPPHPLTPYPPLIVNVALTGMVPTRDRVPYVPVTPGQIAADASLCCEAGASILHLHARDADGQPTWRRNVYEEFIPAIRERCPDVVICVTTSGRGVTEVEKRGDVLGLDGICKPDMASLTLGSMNFVTGPSINSPDTIKALAAMMAEAGIRPELEIFDSGMAAYAHHLADKGLLEPPFYANLMLGSINTAPATAGDLAHLVAALPEGTTWAAAGLGGFQLPVNALAVFMGGHVRTGLEDNPYLDYATRAPATNRALVSRIGALAAVAGRRLAAPAEVRTLLGLREMPTRAFTIRPAVLPADRDGIMGTLETANMHHIPSAEMHDLDVGTWFVAEGKDGAGIVGVCGHELQRRDGELVGKTCLLAVRPEARSAGIGRALQELRMGVMRDAGAKRVITNADRPESIDWYVREFGYRKVGEVAKLHEFGLPDVDRWTTLEAPLS